MIFCSDQDSLEGREVLGNCEPHTEPAGDQEVGSNHSRQMDLVVSTALLVFGERAYLQDALRTCLFP